MKIYSRIEHAFDEEATIDLSNQNGYIHLKGRKALQLLIEFCSVFQENEAIYKIFPMSKSESFTTLQKFNHYIKNFILFEDEGIIKQTKDLNIEKINVYLTVIQRLTSSLETITKNFKSYAQALDEILQKILSSQIIRPFYDFKIDFESAPEEATTSISMSKNNSLQFHERHAEKKKSVQIIHYSQEAMKNMEMIEESDEDFEDENCDYDLNKQPEQYEAQKDKSSQNQKQKRAAENDEVKNNSNQISLEKFTFQIEYLKPGNIPWDLQTIRSEGQIGSGGQGTVFRAFDPTKERQIALKFTNLPCNWESQKDNYLQEIRIQSYMRCCKLKNILEVDNKIYIYQEKYGQQQMYLVSLMELGVGSLEDFLKILTNQKKQISNREIFNIFFDILDGLDGMHRMDFAHKDIKPQNVIYSIKDKNWKIADFGCIQKLERESPQSKHVIGQKENQKIANFEQQTCLVVGTPSYMSPELYSLYQQRKESGPVNLIANDFFSLGVTLLKLREMEKIDRSKLNEKILINRLADDNLSSLIAILLNEDQIFRSELNKEFFVTHFSEEYQEYLQYTDTITQANNSYLETVFNYNENAQVNLNLAQKLECAKTYQNINLREKCLHFFDEVVSDPEFEKLDLFEKRGILVDQAQALQFFGDYDRAYEQQLKCLRISQEHLKGFHNDDFIINDMKNLGQILFSRGQHDQALQKYLQVLNLIKAGQKKQHNNQLNSNTSPTKKKPSSEAQTVKPKAKQITPQVQEKSAFHRISQQEQELGQQQVSNKNELYDQDGQEGNSNEERSQKSQHSSNESKDQLSLNHDQSAQMIKLAVHRGSLSDSIQGGRNSAESESSPKGTNKIQSEVNKAQKTFSFNDLTPQSKGKDSLTSKLPSVSVLQCNQLEPSIIQDIQNGLDYQNTNMLLSSNTQTNEPSYSLPFTSNQVKQIQHDHVWKDTNQLSSEFTIDDKIQTANTIIQERSSNQIAIQAIEQDNSLDIKIDQFSLEAQNELAQIQTLIGQTLNKLGHYVKALKYYEEALRTTEHNLGKNDSSVAFILDCMGESLVNNGKYKDSFRIFKRSYKIKRAEYGKNSVYLAETINSMGKVLEKLSLYEKSAQHYEKALQIFQQHYGHAHIKTAEILNNLGCVKRAEGDYKEAYRLFKEVVTIMSNHYPSDHIELGKVYHDIGNVLRNLENLESSLEYFLKAKEIKAKYYGEDHVEVSNTCQYIGIIYRKMEKIDLAQSYLEMALGPMESHYGKDHIEVVKLVQEIAVLMQTRGLDLLAKEKLEFVLENRIKQFGKSHIKTANTMQNVATVEMELGNYAKSLEYNLLVLKVREQTFGENHLKVANSHTSIAQLYDLIGDYDQAFDSFGKAMSIYMLDLETNKSKIHSATLIKVKILMNTLQLSEAQVILEETLIPFLKATSLILAEAQILLSTVYYLQSFIFSGDHAQWIQPNHISIFYRGEIGLLETRFASTKECIESALLHYEKNYGKEYYLYAQVLEHLAMITLDEQLAQNALQIKLKRFPKTHIEIIHSEEIICSIQFQTNLKTIPNELIIDHQTCQNNIIEHLKELAELKSEFYSQNPQHISLFKTYLLLFKVSNDPSYKDYLKDLLSHSKKFTFLEQ